MEIWVMLIQLSIESIQRPQNILVRKMWTEPALLQLKRYIHIKLRLQLQIAMRCSPKNSHWDLRVTQTIQLITIEHNSKVTTAGNCPQLKRPKCIWKPLCFLLMWTYRRPAPLRLKLKEQRTTKNVEKQITLIWPSVPFICQRKKRLLIN